MAFRCQKVHGTSVLQIIVSVSRSSCTEAGVWDKTWLRAALPTYLLCDLGRSLTISRSLQFTTYLFIISSGFIIRIGHSTKFVTRSANVTAYLSVEKVQCSLDVIMGSIVQYVTAKPWP